MDVLEACIPYRGTLQGIRISPAAIFVLAFHLGLLVRSE